jgi:hypothetical protein
VYGGRVTEASAHVERALAEFDRDKAPLAASMIARVDALARMASGDDVGAAAALDRAVSIAADGGFVFDEALARYERARLALDPAREADDRAAAARLFAQLGVEPSRVVAPTLVA